jgi:hypothetical protein
MIRKVPRSRKPSSVTADEIETLYLDLLRSFYEEEDREQAERVATQLEAALAARPDAAASIRGEEIRSLLAELRGDLTAAICNRESEIRKIFELHSMATDMATRDYVFRKYDYSDISDRLDLLATLFANQGDLDRAISTLQESRQFCESHRVPFDGQDMLDEFEESRRAANTPVPRTVAAATKAPRENPRKRAKSET